jgi:hypothetical protein
MEKLPYKQVCTYCESNFRSKGPNKKYCSRECKIKWNEDNKYSWTNCISCNTKFRIITKSAPNKFCSRECYFERVKIYPQEFGLLKRAQNMRKGWSEKSWHKSIETRIKRGSIITDHTWKQYWKSCDYLTRKIRKQMLDEWDGYDYIDGEYIKDNLKLHFTHKDYPTLDHIKPRSLGFKEGLTPKEITCIENLAWTKRINNSKKHNKFS